MSLNELLSGPAIYSELPNKVISFKKELKNAELTQEQLETEWITLQLNLEKET